MNWPFVADKHIFLFFEAFVSASKKQNICLSGPVTNGLPTILKF